MELWQISPGALVMGLALLGAVELIRTEGQTLIQALHTRLAAPRT